MAHDVFISYSHHDKTAADAVCAKLEQHHVRCWIAPRDAVGGEEWGASIIHAINDCRVMVLVFSSNANRSPQIHREIERAVNKGVIIVPLRIEDVVPTESLEYFMSAVHWLDALTPPLEGHLDHLAETVKMLLERTEPRDAEPSAAPMYPAAAARRKSARTMWRMEIVLALAAAVVVAVGTGYLIRYRATSQKNEGVIISVTPRQSVAVLAFKNLGSADEDWLGNALPEMLNTELAAGSGLRIISGEDVAKATADLAVPRMPSYGKDTLSKLRGILESDYVVAGSYVAAGNQKSDQIRLDVRLQDAISGETVSSFAETGNIGTLPDLLKQTGDTFRAKLNVELPSQTQTAEAQAALTSDPEAARLYSDGLAKLRTLDALGARDPLERAVALEPNWAAPHAALASSWQLLGYDSKALDEAKKAVGLSSSLSEVDQRSTEARYRELNSEWGRAIDIYGDLWGVFKDDPDYALDLAKAQTAAGQGQDALDTLAKLENAPQMAGDPRIDLARAFAAESMSDVKLQQSSAAAAASKASSLGSRYLAAQAFWQDCSALFAMGQLPQAMVSCQKATDAAPFALEIEARTKTVEASIMVAQGQTADALEMRQQALATARQVGSNKDTIGALMNLANIQATQGQVADAQKNEREAIGIAHEIGDNQMLLGLENNAAADSQSAGDYKQAEGMYEQSLKTAQQIGDQAGISTALQNLGALSLRMGDLTLAEKDVRQGLSISQGAHLESVTAAGFANLGDIQMVKGDLADAGKDYQDELNLFTAIGDQDGVAGSRLSLAKLALEEGKDGDAESLAQQAVQEFQDDKIVDSEGDSQNTLAQALILQGNLQAAQGELDGATKIGVDDYAIKMSLAVTAARLKARDGMLNEARRDLEPQLAEAKQKNLVGLQFEIRLALAEIEPPGSKTKAALLTALDADAKSAGFSLVAADAERPHGPPPR
jgi:tetratricopeptide (TPR) repeat protein